MPLWRLSVKPLRLSAVFQTDVLKPLRFTTSRLAVYRYKLTVTGSPVELPHGRVIGTGG